MNSASGEATDIAVIRQCGWITPYRNRPGDQAEAATAILETVKSVYVDADIAELSADQTEFGMRMDFAIQALAIAKDNL